MLQNQIANELQRVVTDTGRELRTSAAEVASYVAQRGAYLATLAGQAGFDEAAAAERDACRLFAGVAVAREADAVDGRVLGIIQLGLTIAAGAA